MKSCIQCKREITAKQEAHFLYLVPANTPDGTVGVYVHSRKCLDAYNAGTDLVAKTAGGVDLGRYTKPVYRWYWVDTGKAAGAVVLHTVSSLIVDCTPVWRRWFVDMRLTDIVRMNPDVTVVRLGDGKAGQKAAVERGGR